MNVQQDRCSKKGNSLCSQCTIFYGSESYGGLCSSCHKKASNSKKEECMAKSPAQTSTPMSIAEKQVAQSMEQLSLQPTKREQKDKNKCFDCNRKLRLLGNECKCGYIYCNAHRLPQNHKCQFNYKQSGKQKLKRQVVKVYNGKITEI